MVGFAGAVEDMPKPPLQQLVVLLGVDAAVVDAAQAEFEFLAQGAHARIKVDRILRL